MTEKLIFISCGQQTEEERNIGTSVKQLIDSKPGYKAYFAEYVQSLDSLSKNIFEGLQNCSGLISFLHKRGLVTTEDTGKWEYRSSVWVNQEIGILAYRKQLEGIEIPIMVFKDKKVRLEGAMTSLIVNPIPICSNGEILKQIDLWLDSTEFPLSSSNNNNRFSSKWKRLSPMSRKIISALLNEGGSNVKESALRLCLIENYGMDKNQANKAISEAKPQFINTDLVKLIQNLYSGDEMSINLTWNWHIVREVNQMR